MSLLNNKNKILIFSRFKQTLALICEMISIEYPNIKYIQLNGDIPTEQRFSLIQQFNENPDNKILLLTT